MDGWSIDSLTNVHSVFYMYKALCEGGTSVNEVKYGPVLCSCHAV